MNFKTWIILVILSLTVAIYSVPTFYEAGAKRRVIKSARTIAQDLIDTRYLSLSTGTAHGIHFIRTGRQGYKVFLDTNNNGSLDVDDKIVKTVYLSDLDSTTVYSALLDDKGIVFDKDTFVFKPLIDDKNIPLGSNSIFLTDISSENKKSFDRIIRVFVDRNTYNIKILRVLEVKDNKDIIFKEI